MMNGKRYAPPPEWKFPLTFSTLFVIALLCTGSALWSQRNSSHFSSDDPGTLASLSLVYRRKTLKEGPCHSLLMDESIDLDPTDSL